MAFADHDFHQRQIAEDRDGSVCEVETQQAWQRAAPARLNGFGLVPSVLVSPILVRPGLTRSTQVNCSCQTKL